MNSLSKTAALLILTLAMLFSESKPVCAQATGRWTGSIDIQQISLNIQVTLSFDFDTWTGSIDIPQQGATGLPLQNIKWNAPSIYFELPAGPGLAVFDGKYESESIEGVFRQGANEGKFSMRRLSAKELAVESAQAEPLGDEVVLPLESGQLAGSLLAPKSDSKIPVVLIIAGSGPTDRDGNTIGAGKNNSLKMLAEALGDNGIASLRIDKRGLGGSATALTSEADLRFVDYIGDITSWCNFLKQDPRFSKLVIAGHSEGSLIGLMSAGSCGADGFISLAGMGRSMGDVLREQLKGRLTSALMEESNRIILALESNEMVKEVSSSLAALYRPSVQPYLTSVISIDPASEISKLDMQSLILQGDTDLQVGVGDAQLLHSTAKNSRLKVVEGMNHILKMVSGDLAQQLPSYTDPSLPLSTKLINEVIEFVSTN